MGSGARGASAPDSNSSPMPPSRTARKNSSSTRKAQQLGITKVPRTLAGKPLKPRSRPNAAEAPPPPAEDAIASGAFVASMRDTSLSAPGPSRPTLDVGSSDASLGVSTGHKEARFESDKEWEEQWQNRLTSQTKKLSFGNAFVLTEYASHSSPEFHRKRLIRDHRGCRRLILPLLPSYERVALKLIITL